MVTSTKFAAVELRGGGGRLHFGGRGYYFALEGEGYGIMLGNLLFCVIGEL